MDYWGNTANTDVLKDQIASGACQQGSSPGYCMMADGTEAGCNLIRECQPQLHFEYALPGVTPNINTWVYSSQGAGDVGQFVWNGPGPAPNPSAVPGIARDPFDPNYFAPAVDYLSMFTASIPAPTLPPNASYPPTAGGGATITESYQLGLLDSLRAQAMTKYGRTTITLLEYCALPAFAAFTRKPCDVIPAQGGALEVADWLRKHQEAESSITSPVGNRPGDDYTGGGDTRTGTIGGGSPAAPGMGGLMGLPALLIIGGLIFAMTRK